jgi:hypothetical protein
MVLITGGFIMKRQWLYPVLLSLAAATFGVAPAAMAQSAPVYWSWGMSTPGMQVGISNAPMPQLPTVVYTPPVAPPVSYGFGWGVDPRRPYGNYVVQRYVPAYGYERYGRDEDRFNAWRHEQHERREWARREQYEHARFGGGYDREGRPGMHRF